MPQLQILNREPGFNEELGQSLGTGLRQGISANLNHYLQQKQNKTQLQALKPAAKMIGISDEEFNQVIESGAPINIVAPLIGQLGKQVAAQKMMVQKQQQELEEQQKTQSEGQKVFDTAAKMLKQNVPGIGISPLTKAGVSRKGVQNRALFNGLRAKFEATLLPMVNKGTLAKERFNYIMSLIPTADESQRSIAGKLYALGHELGYNTGVLEEIPWVKESLSDIESNKTSENKPSLQDIFK